MVKRGGEEPRRGVGGGGAAAVGEVTEEVGQCTIGSLYGCLPNLSSCMWYENHTSNGLKYNKYLLTLERASLTTMGSPS